MLDLAAAPYFLAASLLALGGAAKVRNPAVASRALAAAGLPSRWWEVRALGAIEIAVAVWCLAAPGPASALALAGLYVAFAAFLAVLIAARVPAASCGCAGASDAPPSLLHVGLDLGAAACAVLVARSPVPSIGPFLADQPLVGVPFLIGLAVAGYAAYLAVGVLPVLRREVAISSRIGHHHDHEHHDRRPAPTGLLHVDRMERPA